MKRIQSIVLANKEAMSIISARIIRKNTKNRLSKGEEERKGERKALQATTTLICKASPFNQDFGLGLYILRVFARNLLRGNGEEIFFIFRF